MNLILEVLLLSTALVAGVAANDPAATTTAVDLKVGDAAPKFEALDDTGKEWKSKDHVGKNIVVVYFYPADMTGGCTKQACGFRDDLSKLKEQGVEVVGVSGDNVENHQIFKKVHELNFALLADTKGEVAKAFGVPTSEGGTYNATVDGKEVPFVRGVTIKRWTFVIDKDGKVASKNTEVNAAEDSKAILDTVAKLQKS
jgi:peroxiredoxin Q/BCP